MRGLKVWLATHCEPVFLGPGPLPQVGSKPQRHSIRGCSLGWPTLPSRRRCPFHFCTIGNSSLALATRYEQGFAMITILRSKRCGLSDISRVCFSWTFGPPFWRLLLTLKTPMTPSSCGWQHCKMEWPSKFERKAKENSSTC